MKYTVDIHAWVLMTNHVHLLCTPQQEGSVSLMMQSVGRRYVQYFNDQYLRSGTLWEGRYKSCLVQAERYLLEVYRYIELNPVKGKNGGRSERVCLVELPDQRIGQDIGFLYTPS